MKISQGSVLYADAEAASVVSTVLGEVGVSVSHVADGASAENELDRGVFDVAILDTSLPGVSGQELLSQAATRWPDLPVILVSSQAGAADAMAAVRAGAADFLQKPLDADELKLAVRKALSAVELAAEAPPPSVVFRPSREAREGATVIVGDSPEMREVFSLVRRAAKSSATVLIRGESGTGKELIARQVHELSQRSSGPFVKVHCAALPEQLLESELFGYEKGAFTGAASRKPGRVEVAEGGSLFLDEIGDITAATQVKLLRILQDKEYERLGGTQTLKSDVRFVAATHRNLEEMIKQGEFREDLYYRLNVIPIVAPPLRARPGDTEALVKHFCSTFGEQNGKPGIQVAPEGIELLKKYAWPGNVRQLQNFIERLVVFAESSEIPVDAVQAELGGGASDTDSPAALGLPRVEPSLHSTILDLDQAVRKAEKRALEKALRKAGGNKTVAARILGVSRRTLYNKLQEHHLS